MTKITVKVEIEDGVGGPDAPGCSGFDKTITCEREDAIRAFGVVANSLADKIGERLGV